MTYLDQPILSPSPMIQFECLIIERNDSSKVLSKVLSDIIIIDSKYEPSTNFNCDGSCVEAYSKIFDICDVIRQYCFQHLTTYSFKEKKSVGNIQDS